MDKIHIRGLRCRCIVGIFPEERTKTQDVEINLTLFADLRSACRSDCIEDTIDYKRVKDDVVALVERSSFMLIERLAEAVADVCLAQSRVRRVQVTVDKPGALRFAQSVAVEIVRERADNADHTVGGGER